MLRIKILGAQVKTVLADVNDRICETLDREGISVERTVVSIAGVPLRDAVYGTFAEYGIQDETEVRLSAVVKADSAAVRVKFLGSTVKTAIHDVTEVFGDVLRQNAVPTERTIVSLFGVPVQAADYGKTLAQLGIEDESEVRISAVVKADSARF